MLQLPKVPIFLDSDPGCDDAIAIMLAAKHPFLDLKAITVVAGNHTLENTTQNTLKVCSYLGIDRTPIAAGMDHPILRKPVIADHIHGQTGLGEFHFNGNLTQLAPRHAVVLIIETFLASDGEITYVATGPLTNLAMAIRLEPRIIPKIKQIVLIGGSYDLGNVTPAAEFNIYADPEAAHIVFSSGISIVMIGLVITDKVSPSKEIKEKIALLNNKASALFIELVEFFAKTNRTLFDYEISPIYDPAAIVYLLAPSIFKTKPLNVEIELKSEQSYGRTNCDFYGLLNKPANAEVVIDMDGDAFWEIVYETMKLYN
jgi:ribosylpyrimidine nucleosidase